MKRVFTTTVLLLACVAHAQLEPIPEERGATGLALQLRKLGSGATFLHTTAHPDDEDNGLLVMLSRGRGLRSALLTLTRGDGGQNEIGPELFEALGILRTEELMAMHRIDDVEQYFTRAYEFGYSFSVEETLEKWGKEEILADIVRVIRTVRPDVVVSLSPRGKAGGQHHQASGILTSEAFRAAADPDRFGDQIAAGLRPWQAFKLYSRPHLGSGGPNREQLQEENFRLLRLDTGVYDPVLGRSYYQMGLEARSNHKCQGMPQLRALSGSRDSLLQLEDTTIAVAPEEDDLFDGIDTGLDRLKAFTDESAIHVAIDALGRDVDDALAAFDARTPWETLPPLRRGLERLRVLRAKTQFLPEAARYELEHRLAPKEKDFEEAIALAHGIAIDPIADRGEVTRGSELGVEVQITNRSPEPVEVRAIEVATPSGWTTAENPGEGESFPSLPRTLGMNEVVKASYHVGVSMTAAYDRPYWTKPDPAVDRFELLEPSDFGRPWRSPAVLSKFLLRSGGADITLKKPVQYRYDGKWVGDEKQKHVSVLPLVSVTLSPAIVVFPTGTDKKTRTVSVDVLYKGTKPATGSLSLTAPVGWNVNPEEASLAFERENQAITVRFRVTPPATVSAGSYGIEASASLNGEWYREGIQTIAYHHIQTRYLYHPAIAKMQVLDLQVSPVKVGYVVGVGDEVPAAIRQLGLEIELLSEEELAEGDLSRYDVIMTGVRAYLNREDLKAYNHRLLDYVADGGTLLVQYNKFEFNTAQWGPYPKKVSRNRITVEETPMKVLAPEHPVFNLPNELTENDWNEWIQERGLYFLEEEGDPRYQELLAAEDPWEYNAGVKTGMLVEAEYGKGRWIYIGLGLFRQLPAGVPSAYKLFANLLSLPKATAVTGD